MLHDWFQLVSLFEQNPWQCTFLCMKKHLLSRTSPHFPNKSHAGLKNSHRKTSSEKRKKLIVLFLFYISVKKRTWPSRFPFHSFICHNLTRYLQKRGPSTLCLNKSTSSPGTWVTGIRTVLRYFTVYAFLKKIFITSL